MKGSYKFDNFAGIGITSGHHLRNHSHLLENNLITLSQGEVTVSDLKLIEILGSVVIYRGSAQCSGKKYEIISPKRIRI